MRHKRLIPAFSAALLLSAAVAFAGTEKPNIVLILADDQGDQILDATRPGIVCKSGATTYEKFTATFEGPENCKGGVVPPRVISRGDIHVMASTPHGVLETTSSIRCRRASD